MFTYTSRLKRYLAPAVAGHQDTAVGGARRDYTGVNRQVMTDSVNQGPRLGCVDV